MVQSYIDIRLVLLEIKKGREGKLIPAKKKLPSKISALLGLTGNEILHTFDEACNFVIHPRDFEKLIKLSDSRFLYQLHIRKHYLLFERNSRNTKKKPRYGLTKYT